MFASNLDLESSQADGLGRKINSKMGLEGFKGNGDKGNKVEFGQVGQQDNHATSSRKLTTP